MLSIVDRLSIRLLRSGFIHIFSANDIVQSSTMEDGDYVFLKHNSHWISKYGSQWGVSRSDLKIGLVLLGFIRVTSFSLFLSPSVLDG